MNLKTLFFFFIIAIFAISCNESILESEPLTQVTTELKAAGIGTTYYVAKTGNDNNPGTSAAPFLTVQKAATVVKAGGTVIVKDGIYTMTTAYLLNISVSGTAEYPIIFKSENKWGAKFSGQNNATTNGFLISHSSYVTIEDFEIFGVKDCGIKISTSSSNITLRGNKIHDVARICTSEAYGHVGMYISTSTNIVVEKNTIYNIGRYATGENGCTNINTYWQNNDHGIYISSGVNGLTISNNLIYACKSGWAIHLYNGDGSTNSNISIFNNTLSNYNPNRIGNILLDTPLVNCKIQNNIFYSPSTAAISCWSGEVAYTNCEIKNNITYNGVISYGQTSGITISNNMNNTNPLFVSPGNYDFNLQASSPAIKAGLNVGLTSDYYGNSITGLPDIGAIESNVSGSSSTIYYNAQTSATAIKNSCGTGFTGTTVTYTVSANKYNSTVSQTDADSKAIADLNANKQTYANANGTCTAIVTTVYYNTAKSATATKNDCGIGYTGSTITGTVPAKYFSSTISQADADNKAIAKAKNEIQAYANANGTCTAIPKTVYYNTAKSAIATKNDCGTGYIGSTVTGTVPAKYFSSTISQADADNKAIAMAKNGIQAYANANGTCTAK